MMNVTETGTNVEMVHAEPAGVAGEDVDAAGETDQDRADSGVVDENHARFMHKEGERPFLYSAAKAVRSVY
jgi:hypothetical protein